MRSLNQIKNLWQSLLKKIVTLKPSAYCFYDIKAFSRLKKIDFFLNSRMVLPLEDVLRIQSQSKVFVRSEFQYFAIEEKFEKINH